jgi:hypothetical protein
VTVPADVAVAAALLTSRNGRETERSGDPDGLAGGAVADQRLGPE